VCCINGKGEFFDELVARGVPAASLEAGHSRSTTPAALLRLTRVMLAHRPHVVMAHGFKAGVLGRVAARLARVPCAIIWKHNAGHLGRHGVVDRLGEALLGRWTTRYFASNNAQLVYLIGYLHLEPAKIRVVYTSVDLADYVPEAVREPGLAASLGIDSGDFVVAVLAVLRREKGLETMVQAAKIVSERVPGARFLLIGDGPERHRLERLAVELGVVSAVRFLGNRSDVPALLELADVAALSSYTIENFPSAILEAMAASRPAVCTAVGGLPELIEDGATGYLVPPHDPGSLASRLVEVAESDDRGRAMGAAARRRLEHRFPLSNTVHRTEFETESALQASRR